MRAVLYGRFKQGLTSSEYSQAIMTATASRLAFNVGLIFKRRYEFSPDEVRRFHRTDDGLRVYHNKTDCLSPIVFRVAIFKSQNLTLRTIRLAGFVPRGRMTFSPAPQD